MNRRYGISKRKFIQRVRRCSGPPRRNRALRILDWQLDGSYTPISAFSWKAKANICETGQVSDIQGCGDLLVAWLRTMGCDTSLEVR